MPETDDEMLPTGNTEDEQVSQTDTPDEVGQSDPPVPDGTPEPETFPRAYVEQLRDENAKYRQRAGKADELHRRLIETTIRSAAADHLADPADLTLYVDESDLLDDDGFPDADKIVTAARGLVGERPHLAPRRPSGDIGQGATSTPDSVNLAGILRSRAS